MFTCVRACVFSAVFSNQTAQEVEKKTRIKECLNVSPANATVAFLNQPLLLHQKFDICAVYLFIYYYYFCK